MFGRLVFTQYSIIPTFHRSIDLVLGTVIRTQNGGTRDADIDFDHIWGNDREFFECLHLQTTKRRIHC